MPGPPSPKKARPKQGDASPAKPKAKAKPAAPVAASAPPSKLPERASHVFFLRRFANEKVPGGTGTVGDLTTAQVVKEVVRPATAKQKSNYHDCLVRGQLDPKYTPKQCAGGVMNWLDDGPSCFGTTAYFASHSWTYKFGELVSLLEGHYAAQPGTEGGKVFVPIYYWVDIIAVTQHFSGDFKDHPDSDFPGVIRASQSVLFTMHPWRSPVAPTRVWCLFEALTALQCQGVGLDVILDMGSSRDTSPATLATVVRSIDVRASKAAVPADRYYLLGLIDAGIGSTAFNSMMRKSLMVSLLKAMANKCRHFCDERGLAELMKLGACQGEMGAEQGVLDIPANLPYSSTADLVQLLDGMVTFPRGIVMAGRHHCAQVWPEEAAGSKDWTVSETNYGSRAAWAYLPLTDAAVGAVGRLLQRQPRVPSRLLTDGGSDGGGAGDNGVPSPNRAAAAAAAAEAASGGADGVSYGLTELYLSLREARHTGKMVSSGDAPGSPSRARQASTSSPSGAGPGPITSRPTLGSAAAVGMTSMRGTPVAGRRAGIPSAGPGTSGLTAVAAAATFLGLAQPEPAAAAAGGGGGISRPAEVDSGVAGREELWYGLSLRTPLQLLCLHRSSLTLRDCARLREALACNTTLRTLQASACGLGIGVIEYELEASVAFVSRPWSTRTLAESYLRESGLGEGGGVGELTAGLLVAALASSSLQRVVLIPPRAGLVESLEEAGVAAAEKSGRASSTGASSWGASEGPGSCLQELVLAPVVFTPRAAGQLARVLAALPALTSATIDGRKVPPRPDWFRQTAPADGDWWYDAAGKLRYRYPEGWEQRPAPNGGTGSQWVLPAAEVKARYPKNVVRNDVVVLRRHIDKERAGRVQYGRPASADHVMPDLKGVLELLAKDPEGRSRTAAARAAALRHWLLAAAGPTSVAVPPRGAEYPAGEGSEDLELGLLEALEKLLPEYRTQLADAQTGAAKSYREKTRAAGAGGLIPAGRLAGMLTKPAPPVSSPRSPSPTKASAQAASVLAPRSTTPNKGQGLGRTPRASNPGLGVSDPSKALRASNPGTGELARTMRTSTAGLGEPTKSLPLPRASNPGTPATPSTPAEPAKLTLPRLSNLGNK
ncbi:hypothetical protein HYH03_010759 [Edaphochlamys debaryana]|uniref:Uncharacterized protein n=1 Tax=Edaphochlamys debaryana TaxID=47281 RepID=A0A836BVW7_9CHLO|nr:hypothetical protein HYH03_010759 [Edaphochlamys debaryana]|eukprot:KAG2490840.1 hypothetical protein HYH03_010759 [Edaphochlamys debaryana]